MTELLEHETVRENVSGLPEAFSRGPRTRGVFTVLHGDARGRIWTMQSDEVIIGRAPDVDLAIDDGGLSRRHACIQRFGAMYCVEDLGSTNGTRVDGHPVRGRTRLADGARIQLGSRVVLLFRLHDEAEHHILCELHSRTLKDPLTGLANRRHLEDHLNQESKHARYHGTRLSLLMVDVDHFKRINDAHGHAVGDEALRLLARALSEVSREGDLLARCGGEEFAMVARGMGEAEAFDLGERLRARVAQMQIPSSAGDLQITVSVGIAHCEARHYASPQAIFEAADQALYRSKKTGRNRVTSSAPAAY